MSDLISRQAAIEAIYQEFCYAYCDNCEKELDEDLCGDCHRKYQNWSASRKTIEKTLNGLPSAQPEPQWIPCNERLPEPVAPSQRRGWFITSNQYGCVTLTDYEFEASPFEEGWQTDMTILAWMPLPKPYNGEVETGWMI